MLSLRAEAEVALWPGDPVRRLAGVGGAAPAASPPYMPSDSISPWYGHCSGCSHSPALTGFCTT